MSQNISTIHNLNALTEPRTWDFLQRIFFWFVSIQRGVKDFADGATMVTWNIVLYLMLFYLTLLGVLMDLEMMNDVGGCCQVVESQNIVTKHNFQLFYFKGSTLN